MNTFKQLSGFGAAVLLAASLAPGLALAADQDQTRTQSQVRDELNLQTPDTEQAQDRVREQQTLRTHETDGTGSMEKNMYQNKHQIRNEYRDAHRIETREAGMASGAMMRQGR